MRNDTQLRILVRAAQDPEGYAFPFAGDHTGEPDREARLLVKDGMLEYAEPTMYRPGWRNIRGRGEVTLRITQLGLAYINCDQD